MSDSQHTQQDLRSVFTSNLPDIFRQLGISLAVSTYQAVKVILVRREGDKINTHFRNFRRPMGIAVRTRRLSLFLNSNDTTPTGFQQVDRWQNVVPTWLDSVAVAVE